MLNSMRKKGFNIKDIGNTYLREHVQKRLEQNRERRRQKQSGATPRTPTSSTAAASPSTPLSSIARRSTITPSKIDELSTQVSHMIKKYTPSSKKETTPQPPPSLPTPPPTPSSQQRHPHPKEYYQETPSRKRARTDDGTRYSLRSRTRKKMMTYR